jgi:hypothetical protein
LIHSLFLLLVSTSLCPWAIKFWLALRAVYLPALPQARLELLEQLPVLLQAALPVQESQLEESQAQRPEQLPVLLWAVLLWAVLLQRALLPEELLLLELPQVQQYRQREFPQRQRPRLALAAS